MVNKCVVAKVSLGVSLTSPLACAQLCLEQFQVWAFWICLDIVFGVWCTLQKQVWAIPTKHTKPGLPEFLTVPILLDLQKLYIHTFYWIYTRHASSYMFTVHYIVHFRTHITSHCQHYELWRIIILTMNYIDSYCLYYYHITIILLSYYCQITIILLRIIHYRCLGGPTSCCASFCCSVFTLPAGVRSALSKTTEARPDKAAGQQRPGGIR